MAHLLSLLLSALRRNLFLFTFFVLVLLSGKWVRDEWADVKHIVDQLPSLQRAQASVDLHRAGLARRGELEMRALAGAGVGRLDAAIRTRDETIRRLSQQEFSLLSPLPEQLAQAATRELEIALLRQQRRYLAALRAHLDAAANQGAARAQLERYRQAHVSAERALHAAQQRLARAEAGAGLLARIPATPSYRRLQALEQQVKVLAAANHAAWLAFRDQRILVQRLPSLPPPGAFQVDEAGLAAAIEPLRARVRQAERLATENRAWQTWLAVQPVLPAALAWLAAWWLVPAGIRTVFYFVLAPLAARRPPIVIAGSATPASRGVEESGAALVSAVSQRMQLAPGEELLIRPEYCQSLPAGLKASTRLLFDWRRPLTSIAARLWLLKRLHHRGASGSAEVVVSPTTDPLDELALLELAAGEAFVLQPRALAGMVVAAGQRPAIRSHWRLGTLHAWLTFQLRYLAFEGPATLVVKGCRGVRLEPANAGRAVSQDATLGFSAHALYSTVRAEPFLPYLRGRQALLHDRFDGRGACFLYEEVPRSARGPGGRSNPLALLVDAGLKAFGI